MAPKTGGKVANTAAAMLKEQAREKKVGPTVKVRAIRKGFYGYPLADIRNVGDEFRMRIADLKPATAGKDYMGREKSIVEHDGKRFELPTWCELASQPSSVAEPEPEDTGVQTSTDEDVL